MKNNKIIRLWKPVVIYMRTILFEQSYEFEFFDNGLILISYIYTYMRIDQVLITSWENRT
jgi:hypothetical protein